MFEYFDLDIWVRFGFVQGYRIKFGLWSGYMCCFGLVLDFRVKIVLGNLWITKQRVFLNEHSERAKSFQFFHSMFIKYKFRFI